MILGFKDRFLPMIEDGSKRHTIRAGSRWRQGMRADLYARPRQKGMRLLFRAVVTRVESIEILADQTVLIEGVRLDASERALLAYRDGFRPPDASERYPSMMAFWSGRLPFAGQLIHWDYDGRLTG